MSLIPDRVRLGIILVVTALLPKPLRIVSRYRWLSRFQIDKARRADVLIISYPKSGGTWLRVMISRLYQVKYGLTSRRVVKSDELHRQNRALPSFLITNGHLTFEGAIAKSFGPPDAPPEFRHKKFILLARHPCDIAVSWYFQFTKRTKAHKRELINDSIERPIDRDNISMWDFVMHGELGLPGIIAFFNMWESYFSRIDEALVVRYEDLRARPAETLKQIMSFMGEIFSDDAIDDAVSFASFDNLKALEKANYFPNASLSLRNPNDPNAFKVRRGKVGGYTDYFTAEQTAQMDELVGSRLSPVFGYGRANSAPDRAAGLRVPLPRANADAAV